jgi:hypothetical protein
VQIPSNESTSPVVVAVSGSGLQPASSTPIPNTTCQRLRAKLKKAKDKQKRKAIRKKLKRRGCV